MGADLWFELHHPQSVRIFHLTIWGFLSERSFAFGSSATATCLLLLSNRRIFLSMSAAYLTVNRRGRRVLQFA